MKLRNRMYCAVALISLMAAPMWGDSLVSQVARKTVNTVAQVRCVFEDDQAVPPAMGTAVCIDESGLFISLAFPQSAIGAKVKDCKIVLPGPEAKELQAEVMTIDREQEIAFIRVTDTDTPQFSAVEFVLPSNLRPGEDLCSVGLMQPDPAHTRYFGRAVLSSVMYVPEALAYVSGGTLTNEGSAVFNSDAQAIGLVRRQLADTYQVLGQRGQRGTIMLRGQRETHYFTPSSVFKHIIDARGRNKLAWIGVTRFQGADKDVLDSNRTGVRIGQIVPGSPAEKAGLERLDVIVKVNGKSLQPTTSPEFNAMRLEQRIMRMDPGQKVSFTLADNRKVSVQLEELPLRPGEMPRLVSRELGMIVREKSPLDPHVNQNPAMKTPGLIVLSVGENSPAGKENVESGTVITSIDAQPVRKVGTFKQLIGQALAEGRSEVTLMIQDEDQTRSVTIPLNKR